MTHHSAFRSVALVALIVGEGLLLGIAFDSSSLTQLPPGWWTHLLRHAGQAMPVAATVATGVLLLAAPRLRYFPIAKPPLIPNSSHPDVFFSAGSVFFIILQLLAFGGFFALSRALFGPIPAVQRDPGPWAAAWIAAAALTGLLWLAAAVPIRTMALLLRDNGGPLAGILLLSLLAWAAGQYTQAGWDLLRGSTLRGAYVLLRLVDPTARVDPVNDLIGAGAHFDVEVNRQCSGYEGIGLICVFVVGYLWLFRKDLRFPNALLLLPAAVVAAWCVNTIRIAGLVELGARVSSEVALGGFHSFAGILLVSAVAIATGAAGHRLPFFSRHPHRSQASGRNPAAPWLMPFLAVLVTGLFTGLFTTGRLDRGYGLRVIVAAVVLWRYRAEYRRIDTQVFPSDTQMPQLGTVPPRLDTRHPAPVALFLGAAVFVFWVAFVAYSANHNSANQYCANQYGANCVRGVNDAPDPRVLPQPWRWFWLVFRVIGSVAVAPVVEELAFRGYLARRIMNAEFDAVPLRELKWPAIVLSSLAFAALHGQFIAGFVAGLAYALAAKRRGRITDAIAAHATTNALLTIAAMVTGWWALWT